ncbi:MAG: MBL fold metallo-hydrolase [Nitrococcus mobilis]|nr:MBL fold metallo-hydrolase [Nitrococcus mobilis]
MKCRLEYPLEAPPIGGWRAVAEGVYWLRLPLPFALDHINVWLLKEHQSWTLVDAGVSSPPSRAAWESIITNVLSGWPLRRIVITHFHPDHYGLANWLQQRFGARVCITRTEQDAAARLYACFDEQAGKRIDEFFAGHGLEAERRAQLAARGNFYRPLLAGVASVDEYLTDGSDLQIGDRRGKVIIGRGHSPEQACLYCEEEGWLISGDQILPEISSNISVRPEQPDGDPLADYLDSLARLRCLPADVLVLPSHGSAFRGLHERISALERHHRARLERLRSACSEAPLSATEALPILFRRPLDSYALFFAMGEAIAHLHRLWHAGELSRYRDAQGVYRFTPI